MQMNLVRFKDFDELSRTVEEQRFSNVYINSFISTSLLLLFNL